MRIAVDSLRPTRTRRAALLRLLCIVIAAACAQGDTVTPPAPPPAPPASKAEIVLTIITIGSAPDPNGYRLELDQVTVGQVAASSTQTLTVDPGPHTILLADIAANCAFTIPNPYHITVSAGGRSGVTFQFSCPLLNTLDVTTATSGVSLDPDGYILSIDGIVRDTLALQDASHFGDLRPGTYLVRLSSVAGNCVVGEGSSRSVVFGEGQTVTLRFVVTCVPRVDDLPGEKLVVSVREVGGFDYDLFLMQPDGGTRQRLTDYAGDELVPEFSSDGERILFLESVVGDHVLSVLERASRQVVILPTQEVERAVWSRDRSRIAFSRQGKLYVMNANGSGESVLTSGPTDRDPYWSPDGSRIAFSRSNTVMVVNSDGSNLRTLSGDSRAAGPWSPDGRKLVVNRIECFVYYYYCYFAPVPSDLAILDVETGLETPLTTTPFQPEWSPVWSSDGQRVFYIGLASGNPDVFVSPLNGVPLNLTHSAAREEWVSLGQVAGSPVRASLFRSRNP
jgi:WD40 repeat protein